jgi:hypothetical protein
VNVVECDNFVVGEFVVHKKRIDDRSESVNRKVGDRFCGTLRTGGIVV